MSEKLFERAWGHYTTLLQNLIDKGTPKTGVFQPFNFANLLPYNANAKNYNNFLLYNLSNYIAPTEPSYSNENVDEQVLTHPSKLEDGYANFLDEFNDLLLRSLSSDLRRNYDVMRDELKIEQNELRDYLVYVNDEWNKHRTRTNIPQDRWESEKIIFEREFGYSMQVDRYKEEIKRINVRINAFLKSNTSRSLWRLVDAKAYFDDSNYSVLLPPSSVFDNNSSRQYWRKFKMQFPILDIDEFLTNSSKIERSFKTESEDYSRVETKWKVKGKARWGLFSGGGSVEKRKLEELTEKEHFEFNVSFERFEEVEIYRDRWFQDSLFSSIGKEFPQYWGPNGILGAIPYSMVMARGTKITVKTSEEYKKVLEKFIKGGGSFGFGSFFGGSAGYSRDEKYMNYRKEEQGFSLEDSNTTIRILGARVRRFNWENDFNKDYYAPMTSETINSAYDNFKKQNKG
nr:hypothetical protein [uncultured Allomuricauda sp.]